MWTGAFISPLNNKGWKAEGSQHQPWREKLHSNEGFQHPTRNKASTVQEGWSNCSFMVIFHIRLHTHVHLEQNFIPKPWLITKLSEILKGLIFFCLVWFWHPVLNIFLLHYLSLSVQHVDDFVVLWSCQSFKPLDSLPRSEWVEKWRKTLGGWGWSVAFHTSNGIKYISVQTFVPSSTACQKLQATW